MQWYFTTSQLAQLRWVYQRDRFCARRRGPRCCAKIDGRGDGIGSCPRQLGCQSTRPSSILAVGSFGSINYFQGALPELHVAIMNEMHVGFILATIIRSTEIKGVYIRHGFVT